MIRSRTAQDELELIRPGLPFDIGFQNDGARFFLVVVYAAMLVEPVEQDLPLFGVGGKLRQQMRKDVAMRTQAPFRLVVAHLFHLWSSFTCVIGVHH